jgi:hypothetical protein
VQSIKHGTAMLLINMKNKGDIEKLTKNIVNVIWELEIPGTIIK